MAKTIKQMADALGVDKQRVYRYIKKNCISEAHQKNGVMYYDEVVEKRIEQAFSQNEPYQESASSDTVFDVLLKQSEMLRKELEAKDKQIESLQHSLDRTTAALVSAQESIKAAQLLQANSEQKLKMIEKPAEEAERQGRKHWWQRWVD